MDEVRAETELQRDRNAYLMSLMLDRCMDCFNQYLNVPESTELKADWAKLKNEYLQSVGGKNPSG